MIYNQTSNFQNNRAAPRKTRRRRSQNKRRTNLALNTILADLLEKFSVLLLPMTLLILLVLIVLGLSGNISAHLESQPSSLLAIDCPQRALQHDSV